MHLDILTPDEKLYEGAADAITVPGSNGILQILKGHAALISSLGKGDVKVNTPEGEKIFKIEGGVVEVVNNKVIVLAE